MAEQNEMIRRAAGRHTEAFKLIKEVKRELSDVILNNRELYIAAETERGVSYQRSELYRKLDWASKALATARDKFYR